VVSLTELPRDQRNVAYFERVAERYAGLYAENSAVGAGFRLRQQRVFALFDKPRGKVLDVGCGPGVAVAELLARGCTYHGVDAAAGMIEQCRRRFGDQPRAHFSVATAEHTGMPDATFDAVLCIGVLDRLAHDGPVFAELTRVLKPGGTLLVTASNVSSPYAWWRDFIYYPVVALGRALINRLRGQKRPPGGGRHRLHSAGAVAGRLTDLGCHVEDIAYTGFLFWPSPLDTALPGLVAASMQHLEPLGRGPLRRLGFCFVLKARKLGQAG